MALRVENTVRLLQPVSDFPLFTFPAPLKSPTFSQAPFLSCSWCLLGSSFLLTDVFYFFRFPYFFMGPFPHPRFLPSLQVHGQAASCTCLPAYLPFFLPSWLPASCVLSGSPPLAFHMRMLDSSTVSVVWVPPKALGDFVWIQAILHSSGSLL